MRIATQQEVADLFNQIYKPPKINTRQGGQALSIQQPALGMGLNAINLKRAASIPSRISVHSIR